MIFEFGQYIVDIDVEKTRSFYEEARVVNESCSCSGCRNYEKAVTGFSPELLSFFSQLGIDMKKVCDVYVNCNNHDGTLYYGGIYHVCGILLSGESAWISIDSSTSYWENKRAFEVVKGFLISFQKKCDLLENEFPSPALQLDISANIPWVLSETNNYS